MTAAPHGRELAQLVATAVARSVALGVAMGGIAVALAGLIGG